MNPKGETGPWLALVNMLLLQAPGITPSTIRIRAGETFFLDGNEGFDLDLALRLGQVVAYEPNEPQPDLLQEPTPEPRRRKPRTVPK